MPRYKRRTTNTTTLFKRKYKSPKTHKHLTHVVANMPPTLWNYVQTQATQYKPSSSKIKPAALQFIENTEYSSEFNLALQTEHETHNDHSSNFHKGGGLEDAFNSLLSTSWDQIRTLPGGQYLHDLVSNPDYGVSMTPEDRQNADVIRVAYNRDLPTREKTIHGWVEVPEFKNTYIQTYWNPGTNQIYVGVAGSKSFTDFAYHDVGILLDQKPGETLINETRDTLVKIAQQFPEAELTVSSHSLGGSTVTNSFLNASEEEKESLDKYKSINYFNPGGSPVADMSPVHSMLQDPRVKLFINKSDIINQAYNQARDNTTYVVFADATTNPLDAHGMSQWGSGDFQPNKDIDWGDDFYTEYDNSTWDVGDNTTEAFDNI